MESSIILHGYWTGNYFILWAEESDGGSFWISDKNLRSILGVEGEQALEPIQIPVDSNGSPVLSFPSFDYEFKNVVELKPFTVKGLKLSAGKAARFLISIEDLQVAVADDALFWAKASRFLMSLLSRQRFLPTIDKEGSSYVSKWILSFSDPADAERLEALKRAMPFSAAAGFTETLADFLNRAADELIREWLSEDNKAKSWLTRLFGDTLASEWYRSLISHDGRARGLEKIKQDVDLWISEVEAQVKGEYRTSFRLEPPKSASDPWILRFELQSTKDPTLLVTAEKVWEGELGYDAKERLLKDLGKASRFCRAIERSLMSSRPSSAVMNTEQAYEFLKNDAWLLRESGYGVFVPAMERSRPKLRIKVRTESTGFFSFDSVVEFDWTVAVGDSELSQEEFMKLASLKQQLAYVNGKWVELDDVNRVLKIVEKFRKGMSVQDALRLATEGDEYVESVEGEGELGEILEHLKKKETLKIMKQPDGLRATLRPYQQQGYSWLVFMSNLGLGAILADDMGLGKTLQAIAFILIRKGPSLVIVPTSIVGNWRREIEKFAPSLRVMIHHGSGRLGGEKFIDEAKKYDLVISTYSLLSRDIEHLSKVYWDTVVLDEAQNIKNPWTKQAQAARKLKAKFRLALTGTPVENRLSELWSIMDFLNPGYLGSLKDFKINYAIPIERYGDPRASESLHRLVEPFIMRRLKTDKRVIQDLPEKLESNVYVNLTVEQATLYQSIVESMMKKIESSEDMKRKGLILSALTKLKQVCDHPSLFLSEQGRDISGRSGKLDRLTEMLEEVIESGDRALVFTQFVEMGEMLRKHITSVLNVEASFLHGGVPRAERDEMISKFQREGSPVKVFIISLRAGGLGLNLTGASYVFHYDRWWNPAVEDQATDRAYRIGQRKDVHVYRLISEGTIEEKIEAMMESKRGLLEKVIGESWITELSTEELRELFSLKKGD